MYRGWKIIAIVPACNEEGKIGRVVERIDRSYVDTVLVIDDGSDDGTVSVSTARGAVVLSMESRSGVGAAIRKGLEYARGEGFDIAVFLAGNNKDNPSELPALLDPICEDGQDFVMGSRFMPGGGGCGGGMPIYRRLATRVHPWLINRFTGRRLTESTNGFRALKLSVLDDPRIKLYQRWLDTYGLEVYLLWKILKLGYRHVEVPCTKTYPPKGQGYTKMTPFIGWWSILRPILLLGFGLRR